MRGEGRGGGWWGGDWWDFRVRTLEIFRLPSFRLPDVALLHLTKISHISCYVKLVPVRFTESCSPETFTVFLLALNGACRTRAELYFPLL